MAHTSDFNILQHIKYHCPEEIQHQNTWIQDDTVSLGLKSSICDYRQYHNFNR